MIYLASPSVCGDHNVNDHFLRYFHQQEYNLNECPQKFSCFFFSKMNALMLILFLAFKILQYNFQLILKVLKKLNILKFEFSENEYQINIIFK